MSTTSDIEIDLHELRRAVNVVLDHMESKGKQKIKLTRDYYWEIDEESRYVTDKPEATDLTVGQLSDDWETVVKLAEDNRDVLSWHLVPISTVLRWLGESEMT